jgi:hypothetical protein
MGGKGGTKERKKAKRGKKYKEQLDLATPKQWQELVPESVLREVAEEHGGDVKDGKLTAPIHFWVMLVGALACGCCSLKDKISVFAKRFGGLFGVHDSDDDKPWVSPSALSQRNQERPVPFWENLYRRLREWHFGAGWRRKVWKKEFADVEAIDSSTFKLVARLSAILSGCGSYAAVKIHQVFNVDSEIPAEVFIGPAREHDQSACRKALQELKKGVLYLFDRGYSAFAWWWSIIDVGGYFITPLKDGVGYVHVRWLNRKDKRGRVRDHLIRIPGMDREGAEVSFVLLRLVEILQADGTWWRYVTNLTNEKELSPEDIADIYSLRWRIEIFFRHFKHTLDKKRLEGKSQAAIIAELYTALIAYVLAQAVLMWAARQANLTPESFRFALVVRELGRWLLAQLRTNVLLPFSDLIYSVKVYAKEIYERRNPSNPKMLLT